MWCDVASVQPSTSYDLTPVTNDSLPLFESLSSARDLDMNMSCDAALLGANSSSADVAEFICDVLDTDAAHDSTTLSVTMEHYSSAAAALNDNSLTALNDSSLTDTNALFQQLLRANILLDELSYDNSTFLQHGNCTFIYITATTDVSSHVSFEICLVSIDVGLCVIIDTYIYT